MPLMVLQLSGSGPDLFRQYEAAQLDFKLLLKIRSVVVCCCNRNPSLRTRRIRRVSGTRKSQILSSAAHLKRSAFRSFCMLRYLFIEVRENVWFFFYTHPLYWLTQLPIWNSGIHMLVRRLAGGILNLTFSSTNADILSFGPLAPL